MFKQMKTTALSLILAAGCLVASNASAAIFVEFKSPSSSTYALVGESTTQGFANLVVAQSMQMGVGTSVAYVPGAKVPEVSRSSFSEIVLTKELDKASPRIMEAVAAGARYGEVNIIYTRNNNDREVEYLRYTLKDVIISSWSTSSGGEIPTESVSLFYLSIKQTYTPITASGPAPTPVIGQWNIATNKPLAKDLESSTTEPVSTGEKPASTGTEVTVE